MSNLKQRVQQIQQQLVVSETVARFREVKASMDDGFAATRKALDEAMVKVGASLNDLETALIDQGERNRAAVDQLLELVIEQDQQTQKKLADHEARLRRLEGAA